MWERWGSSLSAMECSDPLICGLGCCEIVAESGLACMDFDMGFLSYLGPWCHFRHILKHLCYVYQLQMLSLCYYLVIMTTWVDEREIWSQCINIEISSLFLWPTDPLLSNALLCFYDNKHILILNIFWFIYLFMKYIYIYGVIRIL